MKQKKIRQLLAQGTDGQEVAVCGFVKSKRVSKNFAFVVLNDGSQQFDLQVVVDANTPGFAKLEALTTGSAVRADGQLKESPGKGQKWEVHAQDLTVYGSASAETYPLQKKGHSLEFLREIGHLRPRTNTFGAVFRVRNALSMAVHNFFQERGFFWVHTPILTASDCEGAGEMFRVTTQGATGKPEDEFFGKPAHLTVSGQLEAELLCHGLGDVYTFGPTFRAENSNTSRHLAEFWMIEPEMAFADLSDDMDLAEEFLRSVFSEVIERCPIELAFFEKQYKAITIEQLSALAQAKFVRMSYTDAVSELKASGKKFEFPVDWGSDLQSEHERFLTENICKGPVIVHDYPKEIKAFYMRSNDDGKTVAAMDVLVPRIGELVGGAQREERLEALVERMQECEIPVEHMEWYLDIRRYGTHPHAGFGLGFERLIQYVTGMANIRDVIPFPRTPGSIEF